MCTVRVGDPSGTRYTAAVVADDDLVLRFDEAAIKQLLESPEGPTGRWLHAAGLAVQTQAKRLASTPGRGRTYTRGGVTHVASAPGDPPAVDTGRLRASIGSELARDAQGLFVRIGSNYETALWLELGTRRMAARPFLVPALPAAKNVDPGQFGSVAGE